MADKKKNTNKWPLKNNCATYDKKNYMLSKNNIIKYIFFLITSF